VSKRAPKRRLHPPPPKPTPENDDTYICEYCGSEGPEHMRVEIYRRDEGQRRQFDFCSRRCASLFLGVVEHPFIKDLAISER
jgi:hypothetical protein